MKDALLKQLLDSKDGRLVLDSSDQVLAGSLLAKDDGRVSFSQNPFTLHATLTLDRA